MTTREIRDLQERVQHLEAALNARYMHQRHQA